MSVPPDEEAKPPQGWYNDPYGIHEARWFSQGVATGLVRDGRVESQSAPPDYGFEGPLVALSRAEPAAVAGDDLKRADPQEPTYASGSQFDYFGTPVADGEAIMPPTAAAAMAGVPYMTVRTDGAPPSPRHSRTVRWVMLFLALGWELLLVALILSATPATVGGAAATQAGASKPVAHPAVVALFGLFLLACWLVVAVGFVKRWRSGSEESARTGMVVSGILGLLGILSLASIGLPLMILAAALCVVALPMKKPRPIPGDPSP